MRLARFRRGPKSAKGLLLAVAIGVQVVTEDAVATTIEVWTASDAGEKVFREFEAASGIGVELRQFDDIREMFLQALYGNFGGDVLYDLPIVMLEHLGRQGRLAALAEVPSGPLVRAMGKANAEKLRWVPTDAIPLVICARTGDATAMDVPTTWIGFADAKLPGPVVAPDPRTSAGGYALVTGWLNYFVEFGAGIGGASSIGGWSVIDRIDSNVERYTNSSYESCERVAKGEAQFGFATLDVAAELQAKSGLEVILPRDASIGVIMGVGILQRAGNLEAAQGFVSWLDEGGWKLTFRSWQQHATLGVGGDKRPYDAAEFLERFVQTSNIPIVGTLEDMESILTEWSARYDAKAGK